MVGKESEKENKNQECTDMKCPIHGDLPTHGFKFETIVVSDKMQHSAVVERAFVSKVQKYRRYEKKTTRISVHNPACISAKTGDKVLVQECRPLSKTKSYTIVKKL